MERQLEVWLFGVPIGLLTQLDGRLGFAYLPAWLASGQVTPLSQSLPLQAESFDDRATRPFFAGLLPEGDKRRLVAQALGVSRQNDFALLEGIGGECAGAVSLLLPGQATQARAPRPTQTSSPLSPLLGQVERKRWFDGCGVHRRYAQPLVG